MDFLNKMKTLAKEDIKTIILPEGNEPRTLNATAEILKEGFAKVILVGNPDEIQAAAKEQGVSIEGAQIINPETSDKLEEYAHAFFKMREKKGMTPEKALATMKDPIYYGIMMLENGEADGLVSGAVHSTADTLRPALQILKTAPGTKYVSGFMVMCVPDCEYGDNGTFVFGDVGLTINPDADNLSEIAIASAQSYKSLVGGEPRVAMLSFSTMGSAKDDLVTKVQEATKLAKEKAPDLALDGEMQLDAALVERIGASKAPGSPVAGKANVLIFPDLNAGNIGYKLVERLAKGQAYGPLLQGIKKPVNDLSRGCSAADIVGVVAITCVQAQNMGK